MANTLIKITTGETILTQRTGKKKLFETFCENLKNKYKKVNEFFGIEEHASDRLWYYGTLSLMVLLPALTYLIAGVLYGF
ncbi:hypothetical protein ACIGHG_23410 [Bacillus sp. NPDC077411]|uniref:hypothetical protein n=1 Tax=Bacillus sp. NPDC077411 TaxID=3363947 RepID=UPI0037C52A0B